MAHFSVVIISLNEERNIGRCLDSVRGLTDDIVVIDSGSTDRTIEICKNKGARVIHQPWLGYSAQKNFGHGQASCDFILSLDADEALSEDLRLSISELTGTPAHLVYEMNRITNYCGKWIRHCGWYPDQKPRFFDRRIAKWDGAAIHEDLYVEPGHSRGFLKGDILHYSYYSIADHIQQIDLFTEINAIELFEKGKKVSLFKLIYCTPVRFIRDYFIQLGLLDGYYGYVICRLSAEATFLKYLKLKQLNDNASHPPKSS